MAHEEVVSINQIHEYRKGYRPFHTPNINGNSTVDLLFQPLLGGTIQETKMGKMILPQQLSMWFFRGQNKEYQNWNASIFREPIIMDSFDIETRTFYRELQLREFELLINDMPRVKDWRNKGFCINVEALAQHYGLYTTMIDITNNFDVALFFACCKYEYEINGYRPLTQNDINEPHSQYGIIFRTSVFGQYVANNKPQQAIIPIGYQPYSRPQNQCGFIICDAENNNIPDYGFELKIEFKHDLDYSKKIFDEFDGGEKIFTKADFSPLEQHVLNIRDAKSFSIEAFEKTCDELNYPKPKMQNDFNKKGISIGAKPYDLSIEEMESIDKDWDFDSFIKKCGIMLREFKIL